MRLLVLLLGLLLFGGSSFACTTFFINKNGQMVFGRNYDWLTDAGSVYTNSRGLAKTSLSTGNGTTISWVSQYGSITFNQYGKEFPTGGMNEKGLVVELMWLDGTTYPSADSRAAIGVLQWIQYQLDNCSTVKEVIATDKKLRISSVGNTPLHYLVADANGQVASIEFLDGKMVVHTGKELSMPVLTNTTYSESIDYYRQSRQPGNPQNGNNSLERFGKACSMIRELQSGRKEVAPVDYAFTILGAVAQGSFTKWSIVYDISNRSIQFTTHRFQQRKTVRFTSFDFTCNKTSKAWDMNQVATGDISARFGNFTASHNKKLIETAFKESRSRLDVDDKTIATLVGYPSEITCKQ